MAGLQRDDKGPFIQFTGPDRVRRKLRLTGFAERKAERYAEKINALNRHAKYGMPLDDELSAWVKKLDETDGRIAAKLAQYGIIHRAAPATPPAPIPTLGPFLTSYIESRSDVKYLTGRMYASVKRNLIKYFGADAALPDITAGHADKFRLWLLRSAKTEESGNAKCGEGLADNTARRRCAVACQFFRAAVRERLIQSNPFDGVGGTVRSNKARMYFVSRQEADKVLAACPDNEMRLFFALSRYGGLRTPSEHRGLRWVDVDWERGKFLVHSPKTEHLHGGESRWVPIFPELRPYLQTAWDEAEDGAVYVLSKYRKRTNMRMRFELVIKNAGLTQWPKLFQNLRSTRQTELEESGIRLSLVCAWLGNKAAIAAEHYLQITDADFAAASGANLARPCKDSTTLDGQPPISMPDDFASGADESEPVLCGPMDSPSRNRTRSSEQIRNNSAERTRSPEKPSEGGASLGANAPEIDSDSPDDGLAKIVASWPTLDDATRQKILALVERADL